MKIELRIEQKSKQCRGLILRMSNNFQRIQQSTIDLGTLEQVVLFYYKQERLDAQPKSKQKPLYTNIDSLTYLDSLTYQNATIFWHRNDFGFLNTRFTLGKRRRETICGGRQFDPCAVAAAWRQFQSEVTHSTLSS